MKLPILIAMVLYMAMVIWIGVIYSKKTKTSEDYFLGGRGLGPWVTAMSAEASDMSSWLLTTFYSNFNDDRWKKGRVLKKKIETRFFFTGLLFWTVKKFANLLNGVNIRGMNQS